LPRGVCEGILGRSMSVLLVWLCRCVVARSRSWCPLVPACGFYLGLRVQLPFQVSPSVVRRWRLMAAARWLTAMRLRWIPR
jgi:hypothetical protein